MKTSIYTYKHSYIYTADRGSVVLNEQPHFSKINDSDDDR